MEAYDFDSLSGASNSLANTGNDALTSGNTSSGSSSNSSADMNELLRGSPFGVLTEVLGEEGLSSIFSGLGGSSGSSPFGGGSNSSMSGDLAYGGNPFAGENFWNIFAGGVNPDNVSSFSGAGGSSSFGSV